MKEKEAFEDWDIDIEERHKRKGGVPREVKVRKTEPAPDRGADIYRMLSAVQQASNASIATMGMSIKSEHDVEKKLIRIDDKFDRITGMVNHDIQVIKLVAGLVILYMFLQGWKQIKAALPEKKLLIRSDQYNKDILARLAGRFKNR